MRQHTGRNQLTSMGGAGKTLIEGTTDEAATVTVNGQPAAVTKLGPSGPWRFQKEMDFPDGQTNISVVATDGSNNVRTKNYTVTVDAANGARTLEYDANGNLTKIRDGTNAVIRLCEWDAENRLLAVQSAETAAAGVKRSEFVYDGAGRRVRQIEKEHNGSQWVVQSDWTYVWDGLELAQKRDTATGAVLLNYFGGGEQSTGGALVYLPDHLGSPRAWYRVSDGTRGEADFSAYGQRTVTTTGPGVPERGFTGHLHHPASGLVLAPFRAYDPEVGRWLSEDPLGEDGGANLYWYVGNGPAGAFDPLGLLEWHEAFHWYADHGGTALNNFLGGFSNSWLFGAPNLIYGATGLQGADPCSGWTSAGEWTATGVGLATGGVGAAKGLTKVGSQSLRKQLYEIGQKTLTPSKYAYYAGRNADPVRRGIDIVRQEGWRRASTPSLSGLATQSWKTLWTGLTPTARAELGNALTAGYGLGVGARGVITSGRGCQ